MDRRVPVALALLVAVLLVANPLYLFTHAGQQAYDNGVERIDRAEVSDDVTVHRYGELSDEARRAFDAALASPDGSATVHGEANRPPEFVYTDAPEYGQGMYVLEKGGRYYRLTTYSGGGLFPFDLFAAVGLGALGVAVGGAGVVGYRRRRARLAVVAAAYGLGTLLAVAGVALRIDPLVALLPTAAAVVVGYAGLGATVPTRVAVAVVGVVGVGLFAAGLWAGYWVLATAPLVLVVTLVPTLLGAVAAQFAGHSGAGASAGR